ncbi:hypothetical protein AWB76_05809 [Caballeronia temeraria]|uniref:Uncharacterized protein n=1 Tax=Caballeronia temeraria TaxID=1777137 RepID=A0A158CP86_9BURK|nr:hypothetical protein [Caballeronia temeraria]SAK84163.1 hypothetical protein AWB76_05809 [Caballeronia temeraria]
MCAICNFRIEFGVGHPAALTVAVATREAIEAGLIDPVDAEQGLLAAARARMSSIDALNLLQARIEETHAPERLLALPDFYVFLVESDTWGFFRATTDGFDPDIVPEVPDVRATDAARRSCIVVMPEAGLRAWLAGRLDARTALERSLFHVDAPALAQATLAAMLADAEVPVVDER